MRLPLIFGCAVLSGLLLSVQVSAQDSVPLFGDKTPDIVNPARSVSQLINQGKYADAMNLLERALMNNASSVTTYSNLGDIYSAKAADMYNKASRLAPKNGRLKEKAQIAQDLTIRTAP